MRRLAAAVWSTLWLLALLIGPPWGLVAVFGVPVPPRHPLQPLYLREWIAWLAVLLLWAVWLGLLVIVALQVSTAVRRLRMPTLRLVSPPEGLLAGLVGALVAAYTTAASRGTAPAPPPAAAATPPPPAVGHQTPAGSAVVHGAGTAMGRQPDEAGPPPVAGWDTRGSRTSRATSI